MRITLTTLILVSASWIGAAYAADENPCAKMKGQERAACEKQHAMGHGKEHEKGMSEKMRGKGAKEKGQGSEKGNADHEDHESHAPGAKQGKEGKPR